MQESHGKEVMTVMYHDRAARPIQQDRARRLRESARRHQQRVDRPAPRRRHVRRAIGRSMVRIGAKLAADAAHEPARSQ